jgi:hypothetical protein
MDMVSRCNVHRETRGECRSGRSGIKAGSTSYSSHSHGTLANVDNERLHTLSPRTIFRPKSVHE